MTRGEEEKRKEPEEREGRREERRRKEQRESANSQRTVSQTRETTYIKQNCTEHRAPDLLYDDSGQPHVVQDTGGAEEGRTVYRTVMVRCMWLPDR